MKYRLRVKAVASSFTTSDGCITGRHYILLRVVPRLLSRCHCAPLLGPGKINEIFSFFGVQGCPPSPFLPSHSPPDLPQARIRLWLYVNDMPDSYVAPIDPAQITRILSLVAAEIAPGHERVMRQSLAEVQAMYGHGIKRGVFDYKCLDPKERGRLALLNLPPPSPPKEPKLKGTLDIPNENFERQRRYIEDNLFFTHHLLYGTIYAIMGRWEGFANNLLVDTELRDIALPCELGRFQV